MKDVIETDDVLDFKSRLTGPWWNLGLINMDCFDSYRYSVIVLNAIGMKERIHWAETCFPFIYLIG